MILKKTIHFQLVKILCGTCGDEFQTKYGAMASIDNGKQLLLFLGLLCKFFLVNGFERGLFFD